MNSELKKIINTFKGSVLGIGLDEELMDLINKNDAILDCDILSNDINTSQAKKSFKNKSININKIRKIYKKKKVDYIICNYDVILPYIKKFVKNSVYINKNKLYFYNISDTSLVKTRYSRYDTKIKEYKNNSIIEIDNTNSKNNFIKDLFYSIKDSISFLIEIIGDILMG
jgi:hypothetical protein